MSINQADIWEVEFFPNRGSEIGKKRPAIVVSHNRIGKLPLKTIVPITDWSSNYSNYPWMIKIDKSKLNGLSKTSAIDCFQVRNFSQSRFIEKIGTIDEELLFKIHEIITKTLNPEYKIIC